MEFGVKIHPKTLQPGDRRGKHTFEAIPLVSQSVMNYSQKKKNVAGLQMNQHIQIYLRYHAACLRMLQPTNEEAALSALGSVSNPSQPTIAAQVSIHRPNGLWVLVYFKQSGCCVSF